MPVITVVIDLTLLASAGSGSVAVLPVVPVTDPLFGAVNVTVFATEAPEARLVELNVTRPEPVL
jgi:hypothetical protein